MQNNDVLIPAKDSQKMFTYSDNRYRFISNEPLVVGDAVKISDNRICRILEVVESRPECVQWSTPKFTNTIIV